MGCGASRSAPDAGDLPGIPDPGREDGDLKLPNSKTQFSNQQLLRLNEKFSKLLESTRASEVLKERQAIHVGVVVERLVQRLLCNVGTLDPRFSSKFLVSLQSPHDQMIGKRIRFKYLVRLDALSTPALYPEYFEPPVKVVEGIGMDVLPQGYVKVRVHGEYLEQWSEFINPSGHLRRDKVQERFVEILARAAARPTEPSCPANVDESRLCGSPGKIVDPVTLYHILKLPSTHHAFYGAAECNESRFPDPRDFRIAIVEGTPETRLHISFLSPTAQTLIGEGDVEIVLVLGIGAVGWPLSSDYPSRYPLDHVDVILGYQSVQMDYYVVPKGPHHTIRCEDKNTVWEIRALPTEMFLEYHYSPASAIGRVFRILGLLLELLRSRGVKTINRYILKNLIFFELETKKRIEQWTPRSISRRVLSILDGLLSCLRNQMLPSYIFKKKNLLLQEGSLEEDYVSDGDILEHYLRQLSQDGAWTENDENCYVTVKDELENVMLEKWMNVVTNLLPPVSNRGRRLSVMGSALAGVSYTRRQMEYVALLFREILKLRQIQQRQSGRDLPANGTTEELEQGNATEDVIFLLQIVFGQAKQRMCAEASSQIGSKPCDANRKKFKMAQMMRGFDASTSMLVDDLRRSGKGTCGDDMALVATVIEYLYKASDSDGRVLGPVLRPYLNQLFRGSHENCWFLPEWKKKMEELEFQAIGAFSSLVVSGDIDPVSGILDSANKGWNWAKNTIRIMQSIRKESSASVIIGDRIDSNESGLRIIFTPGPEETVRCTVSIPNGEELNWEDQQQREAPRSTCPRRKGSRTSAYATIRSFSGDLQSTVAPDKDVQRDTPWRSLEKQPPHARLREANPFTFASMEARRRGSHRGLGSIVQALISLQKLTVLQEISQFLPSDEKRKVLNDIKKLSKEVQRLTVSNCRRRNLSLPDSDAHRKLTLEHYRDEIPHFYSANFARTTLNHQQYPLFDEPNKPCFEIDRATAGKPKWRSATLPGKARNPAEVDGSRTETYRSVNEFNSRSELELVEQERQSEDEIMRIKEDSLLGTCRLLRRHERQRVFGTKGSGRLSGSGRFARGSSTLPKNAINTPFYLRVTTFERGRDAPRTRRHATDFMHF